MQPVPSNCFPVKPSNMVEVFEVLKPSRFGDFGGRRSFAFQEVESETAWVLQEPELLEFLQRGYNQRRAENQSISCKL